METLPPWLLWILAIGFLLYFVNMHILFINSTSIIWMVNKPEKQVKYMLITIGNSTPLGLLFDHGCDALIVILGGINSNIVLMEGNDLWGFSNYLVCSFTFYYTTLEEVINFNKLKVFY